MEIISNKKDVYVEIACEVMKLSRGYYMVNFSRENGQYEAFAHCYMRIYKDIKHMELVRKK